MIAIKTMLSQKQKEDPQQTTLPTVECSSNGVLQSHKIQHPETIEIINLDVPQCRICLQSKDESPQPLITPCHCTGSVQYIHLSCFTEWIKTSLTLKKNKQLQQIEQDGIKCDLCKMKLQINMSFSRTFIGKKRFIQKVKTGRLYFGLLCAMLLCTIILLCFSCIMLPPEPFTFVPQLQSEDPTIKQRALQKITMFCSLIVSVLLICVFVFLISKEFLIGYKMKVWSNDKNNMKIYLDGIFKS